MRPRWQTALLLLTLPIWFLPTCCWLGYRRDGRRTLRDVPDAIRWALLGQRP